MKIKNQFIKVFVIFSLYVFPLRPDIGWAGKLQGDL